MTEAGIFFGGVQVFGQIGVPEMLIILVIALLIFGPKKLPSLGKSLGEGITSFKKAVNTGERESEADADKHKDESHGD